jgi:antitoxin (DNA-binding transcriptional repressor) of toxin-antitoxin stability system
MITKSEDHGPDLRLWVELRGFEPLTPSMRTKRAAGSMRPTECAENLIIRYHAGMRTMTATEVSRNFSDVLDAIERGETVTITRGNHVIAEMRPARRRTGADLRAALENIPPPDDRFAEDIAAALSLVSSEGADPWAGA